MNVRDLRPAMVDAIDHLPLPARNARLVAIRRIVDSKLGLHLVL